MVDASLLAPNFYEQLMARLLFNLKALIVARPQAVIPIMFIPSEVQAKFFGNVTKMLKGDKVE
ncbi:MAG: hypothetical protein HC799_20150 [Limnothrix sp. RL_2_0]|nr:hypothetical protein [Limnothrix sp. RL_2_0]